MIWYEYSIHSSSPLVFVLPHHLILFSQAQDALKRHDDLATNILLINGQYNPTLDPPTALLSTHVEAVGFLSPLNRSTARHAKRAAASGPSMRSAQTRPDAAASTWPAIK